MQQEIFSRQQELAQSYQLGQLQKDYAINPLKFLANFGLLLLVAIIVALMVFNLSHRALNSINAIIFSLLLFIVLGGAVLLNRYRYYRYLHVYLYTGGLLYLNGNKNRAVRWQQMKRAYPMRGYLNILVTNEMPLSIPAYLARYSELCDRIKQEIANTRSAG